METFTRKIVKLIEECKHQEALDLAYQEINKHHSEILKLQSLLHICSQGIGGEHKWDYYELRPGVTLRKMAFRKATGLKEWNGQADNLMVLAEEGLGDELLYTSHLNQLDNISAKHIYYECDERLIPLLERTYNTDLYTFFPRSAANIAKYIPQCDFFILASDLTYRFNPEFKAPTVPLQSNKGLELERRSSKIIGISYISKEFKLFKKDFWWGIFNHFPDYMFLNLQENLSAAVKNSYLNRQIGEISGIDLYNGIDHLASLIDSCDIVVTISNTIAHLAGRLHKKTLLVTPVYCNTRWIMTDVTNYYPEMTHIRGEADYVQKMVVEELGKLK